MKNTKLYILTELFSSNIDKMISDNPPIIVIGMHRSGTSMLVRFLERFGIRMGVKQSINNESIFFQGVNGFLLTRIGMGWRCIDPEFGVKEINGEFRSLEKKVMKKIHRSLFGQHLNYWEWFHKENILWGFKDPRTTITLPFWKNIFPTAKIIHIIRDGRDVALSLAVRDSKRQNREPLCTDRQISRFQADLVLWENYINRARQGMNLFDRTWELRFEELVTFPEKTLSYGVNKLDLNLDIHKTLSELEVNPDRIGSFKSSKWYNKFIFDNSFIEKLGYE